MFQMIAIFDQQKIIFTIIPKRNEPKEHSDLKRKITICCSRSEFFNRILLSASEPYICQMHQTYP